MFHYVLSVPVIGVALYFFCFNYVQFFFLTWLPSYFVEGRGIQVQDMAIITMLPWLGATLGFLGGGTFSDMLFKRTHDSVFARRTTILIGLSVATACVFLSAFAGSTWLAVMWIVIACLFGYVTPQACWTILQDIVPRDRIGATGGFVHLLANSAGILAPIITGFVVQYGGGYQTAFILGGTFAAVGVLAAALFIRRSAIEKLKAAELRAAEEELKEGIE